MGNKSHRHPLTPNALMTAPPDHYDNCPDGPADASDTYGQHSQAEHSGRTRVHLSKRREEMADFTGAGHLALDYGLISRPTQLGPTSHHHTPLKSEESARDGRSVIVTLDG